MAETSERRDGSDISRSQSPMAPIKKPTQLVLQYDPSPFREHQVGPLYRDVHALDEGELVFKSCFRSVKALLTELGPCAADIIWQRFAITQEMRRDALIKEKVANMTFSQVEAMRAKLIQLVRAYKFPHVVSDLNSADCNVTPKLAMLINVLKGMVAKDKNFRGVIFVHKRTTGEALADLLNKNPDVLPGIRARAFVGVGAAVFDPPADHLTRSQATVQFKDGTINLLITTEIGYELNLGRCSIAIQFDPSGGQTAVDIQQAPARQAAKTFLVLVEKGREKAVETLASIASDRPINNSGSPPSARNLKRPWTVVDDGPEDEDETRPHIRVLETKTRIYPEDAPEVLVRYVSIKEKAAISLNAAYTAIGSRRNFQCTLNFLPSAGLDDVTSDVSPSKAAARRNAAFIACQELNRRGLLGELVAQGDKKLKALTKKRRISVLDSAPGALEEQKLAKEKNKAERGYKIYARKRPDIWRDSLNTPFEKLHPVLIHLDPGGMELPGEYRTICILTCIRLPTFLPFELFFPELSQVVTQEIPGTVTVKLIRCESLQIPTERMTDLQRYSIRLVRCSTSKRFVCPGDRLPYYFVPLKRGWNSPATIVQGDDGLIIDDIIDWEDIHSGAADMSWSPVDRNNMNQYVDDAVIQDREMEFCRKYSAVGMRYDVTPSTVPGATQREAPYGSILEFLRAKRYGFNGIKDEHQPMLEVEKVPSPLNRLSPLCAATEPSKKLPAKYLIPELCVKYCLSMSSWRTAMLLPSIMTRLDEMLLVKECNAAEFHELLDEQLLLQALTTPSAGEGHDYQRLELLGDSFLKYVSSIFLFVTHPDAGEGYMHGRRQRIVSNFTLQFHSNRVGKLPPYIQSRQQGPRQWWPLKYRIHNPKMDRVLSRAERFNAAGEETEVAMLLDEEDPSREPQSLDDPDTSSERIVDAIGSQPPSNDAKSTPSQDPMALSEQELRAQWDEEHQELGDKCIADVAEAVIGAAWLTGEREMALDVCHILGLPLPGMNSWDFLTEQGARFLRPSDDIDPDSLAKVYEVERIVGHKFKNRFVAVQALTHSSRSTRELPAYERLEFIGDAILDFITVRMIFPRWGELHEGSLTALKGAMVSNAALAALCVELGLHSLIIHDSQHLLEGVTAYIERITEAKQADEAAASKEGRPRGEYWASVDPPKVLSDIVESIIGAIYVSDEFKWDGYEALYDRIFKPFFLERVSLNTLAQHPTKVLHEVMQARGCQDWGAFKGKADTELLTEVQCDFKVHGHVLATAIAKTSAIASREASAMALEKLDNDPELLDTLCDCPQVRAEKEAAKIAERLAKEAAEASNKRAREEARG